MTSEFPAERRSDLSSSVWTFLHDFASYAGRRGVRAAIFVILGAFLEGIGLVLMIPLLGVVFGSGSGRLQAYATAIFGLFGAVTAFGRLSLLLGTFGVLMVVRAVVISIRDVTLAELQIGFVEFRRARVAQCLGASRWDQVARLRHARVTHLMSGDILRVGAAAQFLLQGMTACAVLLAQCVLAFLLSSALALLAFALLIVGGIALVPVLRRARDLGALVTSANLILLDGTTQFLGGLKLAVSQDLQSQFVDEFLATLHDLTNRQISYVRQQTNGRLALTTLSALVGAGLVLIGFGSFHTPPAVLVTLLLIIARMSGPAGQVQQGAQQLAHALPAYVTVKNLEAELVGIPRDVRSSPDSALTLGPIVFENVSFSYGDMRGGLGDVRGVRDLNLTILPGEFVGMTGPSGTGKTTFADILVGLFPPQSGRITIAGTELDDAVLVRWRRCVGYVSQEPYLTHDTLRRNLTWACPQASDQDIWGALHLAGVDGLVRQMTHGLDTIVGERGSLVSGGERQRIALARIILRKPALLVLDEATSAVDVAGERLIIQNLLTLSPRPTIVMIAHRSESLALCDRVLWLERGSLREASGASANLR